MFGSATRAVTATKNSLPALKESQNHQKAPEAQVKATKKSGRWSRFGKFRVETKKKQGFDHMGHTTYQEAQEKCFNTKEDKFIWAA